jgi:hypothetical protein
MECSKLGGQWKVKEKHLFTSSIFPQQTLFKPSIFSFDLIVLFYHGPKPLLTPFFPLLEIMVSCIVTSYRPQAAQTNEEPLPESSLDLTLTQHPCDEEPKPQEVHARLEVKPPRAWYYRISPNSCTMVILLQVNPAFGDEPETVCEGCYETKNTSIFAWSLVPDVGHYRWLHSPICRLPPTSKVDYLVRTIRRILDFLQL